MMILCDDTRDETGMYSVLQVGLLLLLYRDVYCRDSVEQWR